MANDSILRTIVIAVLIKVCVPRLSDLLYQSFDLVDNFWPDFLGRNSPHFLLIIFGIQLELWGVIPALPADPLDHRCLCDFSSLIWISR